MEFEEVEAKLSGVMRAVQKRRSSVRQQIPRDFQEIGDFNSVKTMHCV